LYKNVRGPFAESKGKKETISALSGAYSNFALNPRSVFEEFK
jgi:hypothetical protein